jgi:uncharacterized protein
MYLLNEMLMMTPVVVYVGLRLRSLRSGRTGKNIFTLAYILLLPAFPIAEGLGHGAAAGRARFLIAILSDALPYLLYLILIVVLADLVIGLLRLLKILSRPTLLRPGVRTARFWGLLIVPALIVAAGILNFAHLSVSRYRIAVPRRTATVEGLRIVFASDFHLGTMTSPRFLPRFVEAVNALAPDLILIGGDMLEGDRPDEGAEAFAAQFRRLRAKYGVYGVPGNHEGFGGANHYAFFARAGITLLRDEVKKFDGILYLAGRNDAGRSRSGAARRKTVAALLAATPRDLPVILVDHRPTELEAAAANGVDIQFSGHTHDGQLFPINFITARQYELVWGYKKKGPTQIFVSCGVQLWGPRVRTVGVSEIMLVDVDFRGGL